MSQIHVFIPFEDFVADWYRHEQNAQDAIMPKRGSVEFLILENYLRKQPADTRPQMYPKAGELSIILPSFRSKDVRTYNHLPAKAKVFFFKSVRGRFALDLWRTLHSFENVHSLLKDNILAWMENRQIRDTEANYRAIEKMYLRMRKSYINSEKRKKNGKNAPDLDDDF